MQARVAVAAGTVATLLGTLLGACGGGSGGGATPGGAVQGTEDGAVIALPVRVEGSLAMSLIVDSGSPVTLLDPTRFTTIGLQSGFDTVSTLDVGNVHLTDVMVFGASPCGMMMCTGSQPSGLLGGDVLMMYAVTLDYQNAAVAFDATSFPAGSGAPVVAPFALEGGGRGTLAVSSETVMVPATRIALDVVIEGQSYPMILDTGSSAVVVDDDLYQMITADGRPQSSIDVSTVNGTVAQPATLLREVSVAGAAQANVQAIRTPRSLDTIAREVGHPVRGLLGGSYLQHYLVTLDYPGRQLLLRTYPP